MPLASLLDFWKRDPDTAPNLVAWRTLPPRPAQTHPFPEDLPAPIKQTLIAAGITSSILISSKPGLMPRAGKNIILSTRYRQRKDTFLQFASIFFPLPAAQCPRALSFPYKSPRTGPTLQPSIPQLKPDTRDL